jgi:hypothetical protein
MKVYRRKFTLRFPGDAPLHISKAAIMQGWNSGPGCTSSRGMLQRRFGQHLLKRLGQFLCE